MVFKDPNWDYKTFDFDRDLAVTDKAENGVLNATNPDLRAFQKRGGKLIQYHGWNDPQIAPGISPGYYNAVVAAMGASGEVKSFHRLFMVPGMAHCRGGEGTSSFDMLGALEKWVEEGIAPDQVPASRVRNGVADRTRPLCPYPTVARYQGSGSIDDAVNFVCKVF